MIYFDNAATGGQKPASVVSAVASSLRVCANPGRSGHALSLVCAKNVLKTRELLADEDVKSILALLEAELGAKLR